MDTTTINEIEHIKEALPCLSETALHELRAFADYLTDREKRRKELEERVLKAEQDHDSIICNTVEEAMQAIDDYQDEESDETA